MSQFLSNPIFQGLTATGAVLAGGKVNTYEAGTSTPLATYPTQADADASTNANANPVILNASGQAAIFYNAAMKIVLTDADDVTLLTVDDLQDASGSPSDGTVGTSSLANGAVTEAKIGTGAVTADKIGAGAVTSVKLGALSVTTAKIDNLAVTTGKIAANAVDGTKIAMGSDAIGDVLYYDGTDYVRLAAGTAGNVLKTNGAAAPTWRDESSNFFEVSLSADTASVTGEGTTYTILFNTEAKDYGNAYDVATGIFTVPVGGDGIYFFDTHVGMKTATTDEAVLIWIETNNVAGVGKGRPSVVGGGVTAGIFAFNSALLTYMVAGDTAKVQVSASGSLTGTKDCQVDGGIATTTGKVVTRFSGMRISGMAANPA